MGICFSSAVTRVTGSSSATTSADTPKPREDKPSPPRHRRRSSGMVPCGKRTDFGFGKDFEDRYAIGKLLGHGQFGYTFVATDRATGDRVAVKRIDKKKMILPIAVEDVKREVKILQALKGHENVVHFYNAFEDDSYVYIVMEHYSFIQ